MTTKHRRPPVSGMAFVHQRDRAKEAGYTLVVHTNRDWHAGCPRAALLHEHHTDPFGVDCWCNTRLNDHGARYDDPSGRRVVLWEPYGASAEELARVFAAAAADGIAVTVSGFSPWNPGSTFSIEFRKETTS